MGDGCRLFSDVGCCDVKLVGGKAFHLAWLQRHGFPVPSGFVITAEVFQKFIEEAGLQKKVESLNGLSRDQALRAADEIRLQILKATLPSSLLNELEEMIFNNPQFRDKWLAVRSSAVCEDGESTSFAGQLDSVLFTKGKEQVVEAILKCFASCFGERAIHYCFFHKVAALAGIFSMAVVIQEMIDSEVSGVLFTADPVTGNRKHMRISSNFGVGEGVVSGNCTCDDYVILGPGQIHNQVHRKDTKVIQNARGGTKEVSVPVDLQEASSLSRPQLLALAETGGKIATLKGCAQDIEWCFKDSQLFILQTRPITKLPPENNMNSKAFIFDNSNIQESYCGVTTPLTFSFASEAYYNVYSQVMRVMNFSEEEVAQHSRRHKSMLGLIAGRVYYNINHWHEGLLLLPSFGRNKSDMERMMGVIEPVDFVQDQKLTGYEKLRKFPQMLRVISKLLFKFSRMESLVSHFEIWFAEQYKKINRSEFQKLNALELFELGVMVKKSFLQNWGTPIINDFYVMMLNGKVHRELKKMNLEDRMVDLMAGEEIASTAPTKFLLKLTDEVRLHPQVRELFSGSFNKDFLSKIQVLDGNIYSKILNYIELYGDRCVGELKLESVSMREDPTFVLSVIKSYLQKPSLTYETFVKREREVRSSGEKEVFLKIREKKGFLALLFFKRNLKNLRKAIKYRENLRMARTRVFGIFRSLYLEIGQRFLQNDLISESRDIFFLTEEEIDQILTFRAPQRNLKNLIGERKNEFQGYELNEPPHHFKAASLGVPEGTSTQGPAKNNSSALHGIGCFPGIVRSSIKLVTLPRHDLELSGKILCAVRTDPGWTPLFANIEGLVIERGSTLSHSAVVAREMGIPAVVGVPMVTQILSDGERVEIDGSLGSVTRLEI